MLSMSAKQEEQFKKLYASLNDAQRQAVDTIDGPVMVIAGPGTGKTQILATRVLNILRQTDAKPEEILCLTYTEAAAHNMRQRLASFMGSAAYKVHVHTFHGLCNKIIRDFPDKFSVKELRLLEDLEKVEILNRLIDEIPKDSSIKSYAEDPAILRYQLNQLFQLMQAEEYSAEQIQGWIQHLEQEANFKEAFPDRVYTKSYRQYKAGEIKPSKYDELIAAWSKLSDAALLYNQYKQLKTQASVFEFGDMIEWVVRGFAEHPDLLLACQEQFQYVLVDEYQDTSGIQNHILMQLIAFWSDNPNCFVVGDDDQSIYAFQGARVDNMLSFADKYSQNLKTIVLSGNYRSSKRIIEIAERLIENNHNRLVNQRENLSKNLDALGENKDIEIPVLFKNFKNHLHEAVWIAKDLKVKNDTGIRPNQCAIIYPKHKLADEIAAVLKTEEIPFSLSRSVDILQEPIIHELLNWLNYLAEELDYPGKGEHLLYEILHSPLYAIQPFEIAKISSEIHSANSDKDKLGWREYLADKLKNPEQQDMFYATSQNGLRTVWSQIEDWLKQAAFLNVPQLIEYIYSTGGFLSYALSAQNREWVLEVLTTFLNYARGRNERTPFISLDAFLDETSVMQVNGISIPLEKQIGSNDGVILTTAHGAKGLEFDHVYILSADKDSWENQRNSGLPFKFEHLIKGMNIKRQAEQSTTENFEEKRRLFYVALTRARKSLTLSWSNEKTDAKRTPLLPSQFLVEITDNIEPGETPSEKDDLIRISEKLLAYSGVPELSGVNEIWLQKRLANFKFSPTTLYTLFDCGLKFYFSRIVRVPSAPHASAGYGSALHDTLAEWVNTGTRESNPRWLSEKELVKVFEKEMYFRRSSFNKDSYEKKLTQGRDLLPDYHSARLDLFSRDKNVVTEKWYQSVIEGVEIGGFTDKLVFQGNDVTIVDYKSGNPGSAQKKFRPPSSRSLDQGKLPPQYWFQLGIYHLVIDNVAGKSWKPVMCVLDLLDKDENGEFLQLKMTYSAEELDLLRSYIVEGKRRLETFEFLHGCNQCEWCDFAKSTGQVQWIPEAEDEFIR